MALERIGRGSYCTASVEDTIAFGRLLAENVKDGDVVVLTGGLGTGKTHLTKGLSAGLGDEHPVTSPTFSLMAVHDGGRLPLFHFDLYRLENPWELEDTGIYDVLGYEGVCVLEWGERFESELGDAYLAIELAREADAPEARSIRVEAHGVRAEELAGAIDDALAGEEPAAR